MSQQSSDCHLASALSLLRHSSACCNKFLYVALGFCRDNVYECCDITAFSCLSHFLLLFHSFCFFCIKTLQNIDLGEDSIIHH